MNFFYPRELGSLRYYATPVNFESEVYRDWAGGSGAPMKSSVAKRSIVIDGHKTSVSLEDAFWNDLKEIAHTRRVTLSELVAGVDALRKQSNLSSAIRLFVLEHFQNENKRMEIEHGSSHSGER
jgi:predicted DNA-binding ribbon-helix-helix protein